MVGRMAALIAAVSLRLLQNSDTTMLIVTTTILAMPCLLMTVCIGAGRYLQDYPGKEDLWQLPRTSSLR